MAMRGIVGPQGLTGLPGSPVSQIFSHKNYVCSHSFMCFLFVKGLDGPRVQKGESGEGGDMVIHIFF